MMTRSKWLATLTTGALALLAPVTLAGAQEMPPKYAAVLEALGKKGDFKDGVLKVNIPRTDLKVTIGKRPAPTPVRLRRLARAHQGRAAASR